MKRSEMVRKMSLHIARQAIHSGKHDIDLSWLNTDDLLGLMEECGMLPPARFELIDDKESFVGYEWENEE